MRSVELFSGCGGLAFGLSVAGFNHVLMVEWDSDAVATVLHNRERGIPHVKHWPLEQGDVRAIDWSAFSGELTLVAGGPPCQPFSIGGKHGGQSDARDMWPEAIRAVRETKPAAFLFENVRGLARPAFSTYLQTITAQLRRPDMLRGSEESNESHLYRLESSRSPTAYDVLVTQVNAADYGAAQKRHRVIVAGVRADCAIELAPPVQTHSRERLLWDQWISGDYWRRHELEQPTDSRIRPSDFALAMKLRDTSKRPSTLPWVTVRDKLAGLGAPTGVANHVLQVGARVYAGHTGSPLDQPSKALKAGDHGVPGGENMLVHDDGSVRYFTVREAARLQGLPDSYHFPRSWSESMRQLGNAVPTELSASMGRWILGVLAASSEAREVA